MDSAHQLQQFLDLVRDGRADADRAARLAPGWSPARHPSLLDYLASCGALRPGSAADGNVTATAIDFTPPGVGTTELSPPAAGDGSPSTLPYTPRAGQPVAVNRLTAPDARYRLLRLHKEGGLGQVWVAHDTVLGREVALKVIRPDRAGRTDLVARFVREARVTARLEHPGIVPLYDLIESADAPRYAMRFVSGGTLADAVAVYHARLADGVATPLEFRGLLDALVAVCRAVAYAHSRGVLHRDLKGQNVVLGEFGEVFLLDFGLTKLAGTTDTPDALTADGADETAEGTIAGTPAYMAPEVASGSASSAASDVYGLGAMLYAILTGKAPVEGSTPREVLDKVRSADPPLPRDVNPAASRALEAVCRKAMARRPESRYAGAADLAAELVRWLADEPVEARREPWPDRAARWARRHRPAVAATLTATLTAVVILTLSTGLLYAVGRKAVAQKVVAEEQRDRAEANLDVAHDLTIKIIAVTEKVLPPVSGSEGPRLELTQASVDAFRHFAEQRPDSPEVRRWTGQLSRVEANLLRLLGDTAGAEKSYAVALTALRGDEANALRLAETLRDYAYLQVHTGRLRDALATYAEAWGIIDRFRTGDPDRVAYRRAEATLDLYRSEAESSAGRYDLAAASAGRAVGAFREFVALRESQHPYDGVLLGSALTSLATAARERGDPAAAAAAAVEAKAVLKPLVPAGKQPHGLNRDDALYLQGLAVYEANRVGLGGGPAKVGDAANAAKLPDLFAELAARHPGIPDYRGWHARALLARGELAGDAKSSNTDFEAAYALLDRLTRECPAVPSYRADFGRVCLARSRVVPDPEAARWRRQGIDCLRAAVAASPDDADSRKALDAATARTP